MGKNIVQKILEKHLVSGELRPAGEIAVSVDQVLTQDATGTMAYLQFEAIGLDRIRVPLAVSYVDHNTLQTDHLNADDHEFLRTAAAKYGAHFSRPGNGICHQVHLERFAAPGKVLLGSDSHTPTAGGMGSIAIGVGGLTVAAAMAGEPFDMPTPKVVRVWLTGELDRPRVMAMDVILELLRRLTVKGGVGKIFEYAGPGVKTLSVTERATITNMGAELGATTSIFPSDERTRHFLAAQGREQDWVELSADEDAQYDETVEIDLSALEPLIAQPHSPDNVVPVREIAGQPIHQVCVGSCTNSSFQAMQAVARVLAGRTIAPNCGMTISHGSRQVMEMLAESGDLAKVTAAGARILECACGPCIGMGQAPPWNGVSLRTFNRNFEGRSGTPSARVFLCSPVTAAVSALRGEIAVPEGDLVDFEWPEEPDAFKVNDNMIIPPQDGSRVEVRKGPNIKDVPLGEPLGDEVRGRVLLKVGDNITTDHIMPAGAKILPLRSNIPAISEFAFSRVDPEFAARAKEWGGGIVVGGANYGQGSSREHAAIAPMYLGVRAVLAESFARIHRTNLINFGVLPLQIEPRVVEKIEQGDEIEIRDVHEGVRTGTFRAFDKTKGLEFTARCVLTAREREVLTSGGLLPLLRRKTGART